MSTMTIEYGNQIWKNENGDVHREDGPAIIYKTKEQSWIQNGKYHREDGPAVIWKGFALLWFIKGIDITNEVSIWIKENDFPGWTKWTDKEIMWFKLWFVGNSS